MLFIAFIGRSGTGPQRLSCKNCRARIASEADAIPVLGRPVRATYVNPAGVECEIVTIGRAENLIEEEFSTAEHTWFEGYAWRPVGCARCRLHLGWRYEATQPAPELRGFYGLLVASLEAGEDAGRDS